MQPLSKKIRNWVLIFLFVLFVLSTPIIIGYSKGYRMDDALGLIQTGGIYLHSDIANTTVFLDDEFVEDNGRFVKNTYIEELLPNRYYVVRVQKEGYQSWVKIVSVKPKLVSEVRVMMLPTTFEWRFIEATTTLALEEGVKVGTSSLKEVPNPEFKELTEFFESDLDQFEIKVASTTYEVVKGVKVATSTTISEMRFPEWLQDVASTTHLKDKDMVRERDGVVAWLENGDFYALWAREKDPVPFYFCAEKCTTQLSINWAEPILRYEFYPNRNDLVVLNSSRGIYVMELDNRSERNLQTILEEPNLDFRFTQDGTLIVFDGIAFRETSW